MASTSHPNNGSAPAATKNQLPSSDTVEKSAFEQQRDALVEEISIVSSFFDLVCRYLSILRYRLETIGAWFMDSIAIIFPAEVSFQWCRELI